jgi:oligogalacturonide transport system substrate-binding protein
VVLRERLAGDLETQAWKQVNAERAAGRIARPAPAFEDARMRKFLRDVFERVAYGKLTDAQAAEQLRVHGNALLMRIHGR